MQRFYVHVVLFMFVFLLHLAVYNCHNWAAFARLHHKPTNFHIGAIWSAGTTHQPLGHACIASASIPGLTKLAPGSHVFSYVGVMATMHADPYRIPILPLLTRWRLSGILEYWL